MNPRNLLLVAALVATAPLATAHFPAGTPKACEYPWETEVHDYGGSTGFFLGPPVDGAAAMDCGRVLPGDGHHEYALGGGYLLASDADARACYGYPAHHPSWAFTISVVDAASANGVSFGVFTDAVNNAPSPDPNALDCGDGDAENGIACVDFCSLASFPPGLDGAYHVYVSGTQGHIYVW